MDSELKQYLDSRFETFDRKFETVATKDDLKQQTETLKAYADEQTEKLAAIINRTIAEPMEQNFFDLKDYKLVQAEVSGLKIDVQKIKTALQLN